MTAVAPETMDCDDIFGTTDTLMASDEHGGGAEFASFHHVDSLDEAASIKAIREAMSDHGFPACAMSRSPPLLCDARDDNGAVRGAE